MLNKLWNKKQQKMISIKAPANGFVTTLQTLDDGVFSEELLGKGCVIQPVDDNLYAPFDGKIVMVANTLHAIGIESDEGVEILFHIGLDTVNMEGKGFEVKVCQGEHVVVGQPMMSFSRSLIKEVGYRDDVIMIITNTKAYHSITTVKQGMSKAQEEVLQITI